MIPKWPIPIWSQHEQCFKIVELGTTGFSTNLAFWAKRLYSWFQDSASWYSTVQYSTVQYSTVQYSTVSTWFKCSCGRGIAMTMLFLCMLEAQKLLIFGYSTSTSQECDSNEKIAMLTLWTYSTVQYKYSTVQVFVWGCASSRLCLEDRGCRCLLAALPRWVRGTVQYNTAQYQNDTSFPFEVPDRWPFVNKRSDLHLVPLRNFASVIFTPSTVTFPLFMLARSIPLWIAALLASSPLCPAYCHR